MIFNNTKTMQQLGVSMIMQGVIFFIY